ncbi:hypothetical protein [Streptomyces sp. NPDC003077]|uniref:hypothetical protein n=1 Tax=Streptomyces sp. NPDC003077 TaxID=3154443 RepID=UPI0033AD5D76
MRTEQRRHRLDSEGVGHCGAMHADWFLPALCSPQRKPVHVEYLVLRSATGESVPVYVPSRGNGRAGRRMWVSADDRALWDEIVGERTPLPEAPAEEEGEVITFAEQEIDRTCRAGEEGRSVSDGRPLRGLGRPTGGLALPRMPVRRCRGPSRVAAVERAAAFATLGRPPWGLGPCSAAVG